MRTAPAIAASLILSALLLNSALICSTDAQNYEPVRVLISGPDTAAVKEVRTYYINITGGPGSQGGNYSYKAVVKGEDTTGAYVTPAEGNNTDGHFEVNVTMPEKAQRIILQVNATSTYENTSKWVIKEFPIEVVNPYTFKATIKNSGNIDVYGCQIEVFIDGVKVTEFRVDIPKNSTYTIEYNYTGKIEQTGWHTAKFVIKNGYGMVQFENGTEEFSFSFYKAPPPLPKWLPLAIALILIPVVSIIILLLLGRRKRRKW